MPVAAKVDAMNQPANLMPPMPSGQGGGQPPVPPPMPAAAPAMPGAGIPQFNAPTAPTETPYTLQTQADGSVAVTWPSPDGDPAKAIVSQVFPKPKTPPAFQQPKAQ